MKIKLGVGLTMLNLLMGLQAFGGPALFITGQVAAFNSTHISIQSKTGRISVERKFLSKKKDDYLAKNHKKSIFVGLPLEAIVGGLK